MNILHEDPEDIFKRKQNGDIILIRMPIPRFSMTI